MSRYAIRKVNPAKLRQFIAQFFRISGLLLSLFSVWNHLLFQFTGKSTSLCSISKAINCEAALRSPYSEFFNIPIGMFGAALFAVLLWGEAAIENKNRPRNLTIHTSLALSLTGFVAGAILLYLSVVELQTLCAICAGIYLCLVVNLVDVLAPNSVSRVGRDDRRITLRQLTAATLVTILTATAFSISRPTLDGLISRHQDENDSFASYDELFESNSTENIRKIDSRRKSDLEIAKSELVVTAFIDYNCPKCKIFWEQVDTLRSLLPGSLSVDLRAFPFNQQCNSAISSPGNPLSCELAQAGLCAASIGKLASYSDWAFSKQHTINRDNIVDFLNTGTPPGFDASKCMNSIYTDQKIAQDISSGASLRIQGTPLIFLNGQRYKGPLRWRAISRAAELAMSK